MEHGQVEKGIKITVDKGNSIIYNSQQLIKRCKCGSNEAIKASGIRGRKPAPSIHGLVSLAAVPPYPAPRDRFSKRACSSCKDETIRELTRNGIYLLSSGKEDWSELTGCPLYLIKDVRCLLSLCLWLYCYFIKQLIQNNHGMMQWLLLSSVVEACSLQLS